MKRISTLLIFLVAVLFIGLESMQVSAQSVSVNDNGAAPDPQSILDINVNAPSATNRRKGVFLPRMTSAQRDNATTGVNPATSDDYGLTIFNTSTNLYNYWDGTTWQVIPNTASLTNITLDDAYHAGSAPDYGKIIDADQGAIVIQNSSGASLVTDAEVGIGTATPTYLLDVVAENAGAEVVLAKFEAERSSGFGSTAGIKIKGDRNGSGSTQIAYIDFDNGNYGSPYTLARIVANEPTSNLNGKLAVHVSNAGTLTERMAIDNAGNLWLDGLASEKSVILSTAGKVLQSLPISAGTNGQVLKINGTNIEWGDASVSSLDVGFLTGGNSGDILYNNAGTWTVLADPPTTGSYALTTAGNGVAPAWQATTTLPVTGDDLGNHTATQTLDLNGQVLTDGIDGVINITGKVVSDGINETSDVRFKKSIEGISDALSMVMNLEGVTYNWRTEDFPEKGFSTEREYGVIAQQIEKFIPELVHTDADGYKSVQYSHMVPLLIEAIKEQNALLSKQDSEIAKLKASVESLSDYLNTSKK